MVLCCQATWKHIWVSGRAYLSGLQAPVVLDPQRGQGAPGDQGTLENLVSLVYHQHLEGQSLGALPHQVHLFLQKTLSRSKDVIT